MVPDAFIERELGAGGMATVYFAEDLRHRRQVAITVLRPELAVTLGPGRFATAIEVAVVLIAVVRIAVVFDTRSEPGAGVVKATQVTSSGAVGSVSLSTGGAMIANTTGTPASGFQLMLQELATG